jgi:hypothetical protein
MFGQVVRGHTADPAGVRKAMERWRRDVAPRVAGWLGATAGVTQDGRYIASVRFGSENAAMADPVRLERDGWWADTSGLFTGEVTVRHGTVAYMHTTGDPDRAGFVQVIRGRTCDRRRFRELLGAEEPFFSCRPDILGEIVVEHGESDWTMALYCTTEEEARAGELKAMPAQWQAVFAAQQKLMIGEPEIFDLREPWLYSPQGSRCTGTARPERLVKPRE